MVSYLDLSSTWFSSLHLDPIVDAYISFYSSFFGVQIQTRIACGLVGKEKLPKGNTMAMKPRETTLDWKGLGWLIPVNVF